MGPEFRPLPPMSFDNAILAVRHNIQPLAQLSSVAGLCWQDSGKPVTKLFSDSDPNIALAVHQVLTPTNSLEQRVAYIYIGRFLDRVLDIGKRDFQVFRFHFNRFDDLVPEEDRVRFGEQIGERWLPMETSTIVLELEHIWGPRWEDQDLLRGVAFQEIPNDQIFLGCPFRVADTVEEYLKHKTWITHPGLLPSSDWPEYFEMGAQMDRATERHTVIQ